MRILVKSDQPITVEPNSRNTGFADGKRNNMVQSNKHVVHKLGTISEDQSTDFRKLLQQFNEMDDAPEYIVCPLSMDVYIEPVVTPNGYIYEKQFIIEWLQDHDTDPLDANIKLKIEDLEPEPDIEKAARLWRENKEQNDQDDEKDGMEIEMKSGLKWAAHSHQNKSDHEDENWSENDQNDEGMDVDMNQFKNELKDVIMVHDTSDNNIEMTQ